MLPTIGRPGGPGGTPFRFLRNATRMATSETRPIVVKLKGVNPSESIVDEIRGG